jgi:hypothetical protein
VLRCTGSDIDALESPSVELDSRGRSHDQADQSLTASADDPKCPTAPNWPQALPQDIREPLVKHPHRADLLEVGAALRYFLSKRIFLSRFILT